MGTDSILRWVHKVLRHFVIAESEGCSTNKIISVWKTARTFLNRPACSRPFKATCIHLWLCQPCRSHADQSIQRYSYRQMKWPDFFHTVTSLRVLSCRKRSAAHRKLQGTTAAAAGPGPLVCPAIIATSSQIISCLKRQWKSWKIKRFSSLSAAP